MSRARLSVGVKEGLKSAVQKERSECCLLFFHFCLSLSVLIANTVRITDIKGDTKWEEKNTLKKRLYQKPIVFLKNMDSTEFSSPRFVIK